MKTFFASLLALLLLSQVPSFAQQNLVLVIDQSAQTLDWLDGFSITSDPAAPFNDLTFGMPMVISQARIDSPLLNFSGAGSHSNVTFQFTEDRTRVTSIRLGLSAPPGPNTTYSGTAQGPATPTFVSGDFTWFVGLNRGDYTLAPIGAWSGGIHVVVTGEPTVPPRLQVLRPNSSAQLHPGLNFRIVWRTQGVSGGTDWNFFFETNNVQVGQLSAAAVGDGGGNWHADVTIPNQVHQGNMLVDLPSACNYTLRIHDNVSGADGRSDVFCLGVPVVSVRVSEVEICWASRSNRLYQVQYRSELTTNMWTSLGAPVQGNGATNRVTDLVVTARPQKYYRVDELP